MLTEKIIVRGIEYQVSAHTYKMLQDAKVQLLKSIERYESENAHTSTEIPGIVWPTPEEQLPDPEPTPKTKGPQKKAKQVRKKRA
jgi:hypothetical protein